MGSKKPRFLTARAHSRNVNFLSACCDAANTCGVVIILGWWGHPTTILHNRNYLHSLTLVVVGAQKQKLPLGQIHPMLIFCQLLRRGKHIGVVILFGGGGAAQELSNKKKFIKIGPLLRKLQAIYCLGLPERSGSLPERLGWPERSGKIF